MMNVFNEIEYSSDLDEEFTASFEKISTTRIKWRKGDLDKHIRFSPLDTRDSRI